MIDAADRSARPREPRGRRRMRRGDQGTWRGHRGEVPPRLAIGKEAFTAQASSLSRRLHLHGRGDDPEHAGPTPPRASRLSEKRPPGVGRCLIPAAPVRIERTPPPPSGDRGAGRAGVKWGFPVRSPTPTSPSPSLRDGSPPSSPRRAERVPWLLAASSACRFRLRPRPAGRRGDAAAGVELHRHPLHQAPRRRVESVAPMHRKAVVPSSRSPTCHSCA